MTLVSIIVHIKNHLLINPERGGIPAIDKIRSIKVIANALLMNFIPPISIIKSLYLDICSGDIWGNELSLQGKLWISLTYFLRILQDFLKSFHRLQIYWLK